MKASKGKVFLFSIVTYCLVNLIYNFVYFCVETLMHALSNISIFQLLISHGFYTASIILALILAFLFQHWFLEKVFNNDEDERRVKFVISIFFIVFNLINLLAVFTIHATYYPTYAVLLIAGIILLFKNKKYE